MCHSSLEERPLKAPAPPLPCDLPQQGAAFSRTQGSEEIARPQPSLMTFDNDTRTYTTQGANHSQSQFDLYEISKV